MPRIGVTVGLSPQVKRNYRWDLAAAIACGAFLGAINPFVLVQARRIGCSPQEIALLAAAPFIGMIFSGLWTGLTDLKRPVQSVSFWDGLARVVLLLLVVFSTKNGFILVFVMYYLLTTVSPPAYATAMRVAYPDGARGRLMGAVRVGSSLAALLAAWAGGVLLTPWGPYRFFAFSAIFGLISSICFRQVRELEPVEVAQSRMDWIETFNVFWNDHPYRRYIIALFVFGFSNLMAIPVYVLYQVDQLHVSNEFVSLMAFITSLMSLAFYYIGGRWMDRKGPIKITIMLYAFNLLIPLVYLLSRSTWPLIIAAAVTGIMNAGLDLSALGNTMHYAERRSVAPYFAIHITLLGIRGTLAPLAGPFLAEHLSYHGAFAVIIAINAMGLWMATRISRYKQTREIGLTSPGQLG